MSILDYFRSRNKNTASLAKERLQIIVSHQRDFSRPNTGPDYLPLLQKELLDVLEKYIPGISKNEDLVNVNWEKDGENSLLELNITLPEAELA
jgi:cell division topological specificity factor